MIITKTSFAGRIVGAALAAGILIGTPVAAMTIAPAATAHADEIFIPNLDGLCPNGAPNDCDGDGISDADENAAGLDPLTPNKLDLGLENFSLNPFDKLFDKIGLGF